MWFVSHVCCCKRLVFIACVNLQVFSILLIPLVFDGPTTWRSSPPCHWPLGSWCSCGSCQRCAREASHWLATDRVSICDRLIRKWDIRYSQTSRASDETCWLCGNCSCVCCYYDDTMEGRQLHLKAQPPKTCEMRSCDPSWNVPPVIQLPMLSHTHACRSIKCPLLFL